MQLTTTERTLEETGGGEGGKGGFKVCKLKSRGTSGILYWLKRLEGHAHPNTPLLLLGTKKDLRDQNSVPQHDIHSFCRPVSG